MTFTVGETVVYPNHGAAVIENIETRTIKGEDKLYLVLRIVAQLSPACADSRVRNSKSRRSSWTGTPHSSS